ncbi:MAG: ATP-binding protein [Thermoplasmataceae archaeon]
MEIEESLKLLNNWWFTGKVKKELTKDFKRYAYAEVNRLLRQYKEVIMLTGLRRVGKSTIIYQLIEELIIEVNPLNVIYFSFDYTNVEIVNLLNSYQKLTEIKWKNDRIYLFLDEIQKLDNWASQIKLLYDAFPNIKFIVSGSASLQLERMAMNNLAGRHFSIDVPVLSLPEYYCLKEGKNVSNFALYSEEMSLEIDKYLKKPFPELVKIDDELRIYEYIQETIVSKIIGLDLFHEFNKVDINLLNSLLKVFYSEPGMILNIDTISKTFGKRKQEITRHIYMLEYSKLIRILKNYRPSILSESRKMKKVYPYDISLALSSNPSIEKGKVLESLIISRLDVIRYWRDGTREIDALLEKGKELIPIEIKSSTQMKDEFKKTLIYFISKFNPEYGILLYNGKRLEEGKIKSINVSEFLIYGIEGAMKLYSA